MDRMSSSPDQSASWAPGLPRQRSLCLQDHTQRLTHCGLPALISPLVPPLSTSSSRNGQTVALHGKVIPTGAILYQQAALELQELQVQHGGRGFLRVEHSGKSVLARCVVYVHSDITD